MFHHSLSKLSIQCSLSETLALCLTLASFSLGAPLITTGHWTTQGQIWRALVVACVPSEDGEQRRKTGGARGRRQDSRWGSVLGVSAKEVVEGVAGLLVWAQNRKASPRGPHDGRRRTGAIGNVPQKWTRTGIGEGTPQMRSMGPVAQVSRVTMPAVVQIWCTHKLARAHPCTHRTDECVSVHLTLVSTGHWRDRGARDMDKVLVIDHTTTSISELLQSRNQPLDEMQGVRHP